MASDMDVHCMTDLPAAGQRVECSGKIYTTLQEGKAYILVPETAQDKNETGNVTKDAGPVQKVFYNPIQQFNRDLTVLAIKAYGEEAVELKKKGAAFKIERYLHKKKKRRDEKRAAEADKSANAAEPGNDATESQEDVNKKRKRDEDGDKEDDSNKATKLGDVSSPQESRANADTGDGTSNAAVKTEPDAMHVDEKEGHEPKNVDEKEGHEPKNVDDAQQPGEVPADGKTGGPRDEEIVPRFTILDALSATGLRALRYAQELPFVTSVTANDLDPSAAEAIRRNVVHNQLEHAISVTQSNAVAHMYSKIATHMSLSDKDKFKGASEKYDVIDLDPYGTAASFFDASVQAVRDDGGLLCVTCTDASVWASNGYPEKAFAMYGGVPVRSSYSHETGLRLILHGISTAAARYGLSIEPILSLSIDFYARVFVKIKKSAAAVKFAAGKTMIVYDCDAGCGAWTTQPLLRTKFQENKKGTGGFYKHQAAQGPTAQQECEHCGNRLHVSGPMYAGRLHSPQFIKRILDKLPEADTAVYKTTERIKGMLTTALEEHLKDPNAPERPTNYDKYAEIDPYPFFFMPQQVSRVVHCSTPNENALRGALRGLGFRVTRSHCRPGSFKTDAPWSVIWEVMREWIRQRSPIKEANVKPGSPGYRILGLQAKEQQKGETQAQNNDGQKESGSAVEGDKEEVAVEEAAEGQKKEGEVEKKREIVFDEKLGQDENKGKFVRYQLNPRANWGPMNRANRR